MSENKLIETLYGSGHGDRGYGQKLDNPAAAIARIASHQGISIPRLVVEGADTPSLIVERLDDTRLKAASESLAFVSTSLEYNRDEAWSRSLKFTVEARFPSEDKARFFFNSGGSLILRITHAPAEPTRLDEEFIANLQRIGTLHIGARSCNTSTGTHSGFGFYDLDRNECKLWDDKHILLTAKRMGYRGKRGGNGNAIRMTLTLRPPPHRVGNAVSPGTNVLWGYNRASTYLSGIMPPGYKNISNP